MKLGCKLETGNAADVYEWCEKRVLKLFHEDYPADAIEQEYENAKQVRDLSFAKACEHGIISYGNRTGIVYDRLEGQDLLEYLTRTQDEHQALLWMCSVHNAILEQEMYANNVPYYKHFLRECVRHDTSFDKEEREELLASIKTLPDDSQLCHGNFQLQNIIITAEGPAIINFQNICRGPRLYDVARTYFLLTEGEQSAEYAILRQEFADGYLASMRATYDEIEDYLPIIRITQKSKAIY